VFDGSAQIEKLCAVEECGYYDRFRHPSHTVRCKTATLGGKALNSVKGSFRKGESVCIVGPCAMDILKGKA